MYLNNSFNDPCGQALLGRLGFGSGEQHDYLRDWGADRAVRLYSCEPFLLDSLRGELANLAEGGTVESNRFIS